MSVELKSAGQFQKWLQDNGRMRNLLVIKMYYPWCGFCKKIKPDFEMLAKQHGSNRIGFGSVNMDEFPEVAKSLQISAGPTFLIYKNGRLVKKIEGADINAVRQAIQKNQ
jgi:thioredoxin-like negative regulator of GroEL